MNTSLDRMRARMRDYLITQGVNAALAFPGELRPRLQQPLAVISLRACQAAPSGFQDYLGERFNQEAQRWEELYGRKIQLTFGLDLYAPPHLGEAAIESAFETLSLALSQGGPDCLSIQEFSCGETGYDTAQRLFKRSVQALCTAYLYAVTDSGGTFLDFEIRGEMNS